MQATSHQSKSFQQELDTTDRRAALTLILFITLLVAPNFLFLNYWKPYFATPVNASAKVVQSLATRKTAPSAPWLVPAEQIKETKVEYRSQGYLVRRYYIMEIEKRHLLIGTKDLLPKTGKVPLYFEPTSKFDVEKIIPEVAKDTGVEESDILPIVAESSEAYRDTGTITLIAMGITVALLLVGLLSVMPRIGNYRRHPVFRHLQNINKLQADALWIKLNSEWMSPVDLNAQNNSKLAIGKTRLLPTFFVSSTTLRTVVIPLDEIIWAYRESVTSNIVVTAHSFVFCLSNGKTVRVPGTLWTTTLFETVFDHLKKTRPWIKFGFSSELVKEWKGDKSNIINHVVNNRDKAKQGRAA
jgi:hypothetical protein